MEKLYDISEVCKMFNITSRTLRFYEEKGIITSTRGDFETRRKYTQEQVEQIKNIKILRQLGISIKTISELKSQGSTLKQALTLRKAKAEAVIEAKRKEISVITEAIAILDAGKSVFDIAPQSSITADDDIRKIIVQKCSEAIVYENLSDLYGYLSGKVIEYMPVEIFKKQLKDTKEPLGRFVSFCEMTNDKEFSNVIYHLLKFENLGLKIKYVFHQNTIHGLWFSYYEL